MIPPPINGSEAMATRKLERRPSVLDTENVDRLYHYFLKLDKDGNGVIDRDEFLHDPDVAANPLAKRIMEVLDIDQGNTIDFNEFVAGLSIFSTRASREKKLKFAFDIYDIDRDGYISSGELFAVLKIMTGDNLTDTQLQNVIDKSIRDADKDMDGKLSFQEFCAIVESKNSTFLDQWSFTGI